MVRSKYVDGPSRRPDLKSCIRRTVFCCYCGKRVDPVQWTPKEPQPVHPSPKEER